MHEKYTTRGLIVSASAYREADKIISIYTEDFGLVSAVAAGVRRSASKLRYHAQDFSVRHFSLVRGRDLWRFVGAEEIAAAAPIKSAEHLALYARVLSLIRRLVRGEEKNAAVFNTLYSLHAVLATASADDAAIDVSAAETLAVFRILHDLGYIKSDATTEPLIAPAAIDIALVASAKPLVPVLIKAINSGLSESHL
jgi:DNA repair protein RecO